MTDNISDLATEVYHNRSPEIAKLAAALCKAQAAMGGAKKDSTNPHFKNAYADLASIWDAIRKPLTDNGLAVVQFPRTTRNGVDVETMLVHSSGEYMTNVLWLPVLKMDAQGVGSAITYGRRYALMAVTGIAPIDDDDGEGAGKRESDPPHKPGVPGSAGGGTDFRPPGPRQSSAYGRQLAAEEPHLVANANNRDKGTNGRPPSEVGKPAAPDAQKIADRSKAFVDRAINTLRLSGQSKASLKQYLADNEVEIEFLEKKAPDQHERFFEAYNEAAEKADAREGA